MAAYSGLAGLYDRLMDDVDYPAWAEYYLKLLETAGVAPKRLCDCACGTGAMSVQFALRGIRVTGADISREMLEQAQARARQSGVNAMFVEQDMCALALPRRVDALVCACDGVNYLLDDDRLNRFFARAYDSIRPGGALAFDISSAHKLERVLGNNFFGEERDDVAYLWSNRFDATKRTVTMDLTFFVREKGDLYRRFTEVHVQKAHEAAHIAALLEQNGFSDVRIYGDKTFDAPEPDESRIHFVALCGPN
ncbi:MAG: class I SAM-dependent methyltransferase [Clostridia bacterium]|nr:class I SAM-dependent methyltransferase [Clostridia bacterium]